MKTATMLSMLLLAASVGCGDRVSLGGPAQGATAALALFIPARVANQSDVERVAGRAPGTARE